MLYLTFIEDFVRSEPKGQPLGDKRADGGAPAARLNGTPAAEVGDVQALWSSREPRRALLLHALHGAQEAADAEGETPEAQSYPWIADLLKVWYSMILRLSRPLISCSCRSLPIEGELGRKSWCCWYCLCCRCCSSRVPLLLQLLQCVPTSLGPALHSSLFRFSPPVYGASSSATAQPVLERLPRGL